MSNIYDICIVGMGVSGVFAALKIANNNKDFKILTVEASRSPMKRRTQMAGFLGLLPFSSGQLYLNDLEVVSALTSKVKTQKAFEWFKSQTNHILNLSIIKDTLPNINVIKKIKKAGFNLKLNDYMQLYPAEIHQLSRFISEQLDKKENFTSIYDTEIMKIEKLNNYYLVHTDQEEVFKCKKILINVGRIGWRWAHQLYKDLNIVEQNDVAEIGVRIETTLAVMDNFNKSNCSIYKDGLSIGPLSNGGTVIPEDHYEFVCSSFRNNESRWDSDKVSFNLFSKQIYKNMGVEQANRVSQLAFILTNERVLKEKISTLLARKSKLAILSEFDWLIDSVNEISQFIPELATKGTIHFPSLMPMTSKIKLKNNLESEKLKNFFVAGESAGVPGLLGAITTGIMAADNMCK